MNTKLILVDVDGTLINDDKIVTERTRNAIAKLNEKGVMFGIATGRTPYAVKGLLAGWGLENCTDIIMGFNGGCSMNMKTGEVVNSQQISGSLIPNIIKDFEDYHCNAGVYAEASYHALRHNKYSQMVCDDNQIPLYIDDLSQFFHEDIHKVLITGDPEEISQMDEHYQKHLKIKTQNDYKAVVSLPYVLEIFHPQLSKSTGIDKLCEFYGLDHDEVLVFGDAMNDFEMVRDYTSVAMENGAPKVKEVANYITCSNNDDGIAVFIEEHIL